GTLLGFLARFRASQIVGDVVHRVAATVDRGPTDESSAHGVSSGERVANQRDLGLFRTRIGDTLVALEPIRGDDPVVVNKRHVGLIGDSLFIEIPATSVMPPQRLVADAWVVTVPTSLERVG